MAATLMADSEAGCSPIEGMPAELVDRFIDFLYNDIRSLCSASCVCKFWAPATSFHLFHHTRVRTRLRLQRGAYNEHKSLMQIDDDNWRVCAEFADALECSPRMQNYIVDLDFECRPDDGKHEVNLDLLRRVLSYLPQLEDLCIISGGIFSLKPALPTVNCGEMYTGQLLVRELESLTFDNVPLSRSMFDLVRQFTRIGKFNLWRLSCLSDEPENLHDATVQAEVVAFVRNINIFAYEVRLAHVTHAGVFGSSELERRDALDIALKFNTGTMMQLYLDIVALETELLLHYLNSNLLPENHLFDLRFYYPERSRFRPVDLVHCERLKCLFIYILVDVDQDSSTASLHMARGTTKVSQWVGLMNILHSSHLPSLSSLELKFYIYRGDFEREHPDQEYFVVSAQDSNEEQQLKLAVDIDRWAQSTSRLDWEAFDRAMSALVARSPLNKVLTIWETPTMATQTRQLLEGIAGVANNRLSSSIRSMITMQTRSRGRKEVLKLMAKDW